MTRQPKIPMSPDGLPQQHIHEVVSLPERPANFDCEVGYGVFPKGALPKNGPINSTYLCQVEWAWSPMHNCIDAYYLHQDRNHWSLWSKYWDNNWASHETVAIVPMDREPLMFLLPRCCLELLFSDEGSCSIRPSY